MRKALPKCFCQITVKIQIVCVLAAPLLCLQAHLKARARPGGDILGLDLLTHDPVL